MKRALLSITGTVVGVVALLDFKSHRPAVGLAVGAPPAPQRTPTATGPTRPAPPRSTTTHAGKAPKSTGTKSRSSKPQAASGHFVGSAVQTQYGVVQVAVETSSGRITKVTFPRLTSYDGTSAEINSQAAPLLVQETMSAQSARIDTISGATYTSLGYIQSLQSALDRAGLK